ncbi:hypothetical protein BH23GEM2_BH23GEM2_15790 [soil metagenome]
MTDRNRNSGTRRSPEQQEGTKGSPGSQREPMRGDSEDSGSGSDRSSSNIGRDRHSESGTSGSREESMEGSSRGGASERGAYGSENLTDDDLASGERSADGSRSVSGNTGTDRSGRGNVGQLGDEWEGGKQSGAMRGSSSGTTGLGGERNQSSTGSPGGVEGMTDKSSPNPDEDRSRHR